MRGLRRWRTGLAVAVLGLALGSVRLLAAGDTDWLTWIWFVVASVYAFTALVARRLVFPERPEDLLGRLERRPRFAALLRVGEGPGHPRPDSNVVQRVRYMQHGSEETVTRNRIANALVTLAAVVGMVMVSTGVGQTQPGVPAPTQIQAPAPAAPTQDDDG